jgi:hypothetical protein
LARSRTEWSALRGSIDQAIEGGVRAFARRIADGKGVADRRAAIRAARRRGTGWLALVLLVILAFDGWRPEAAAGSMAGGGQVLPGYWGGGVRARRRVRRQAAGSVDSAAGARRRRRAGLGWRKETSCEGGHPAIGALLGAVCCSYNRLVGLRGRRCGMGAGKNQLTANDLIRTWSVTKKAAAHEGDLRAGGERGSRLLAAGTRDERSRRGGPRGRPRRAMRALSRPEGEQFAALGRARRDRAGSPWSGCATTTRSRPTASPARVPDLVGRDGSFAPGKYFEAPPGAKEVPKVDFGTRTP